MDQKAKPKIEFSYDAAVAFAASFINKSRRKFISDDITKEFYKDYEKPKEPRVWGGILFAMKAEGKIKASGAIMAKCHTGGNRKYFTVWVRLSFSQQQSARRTKPKAESQDPQLNISFNGTT